MSVRSKPSRFLKDRLASGQRVLALDVLPSPITLSFGHGQLGIVLLFLFRHNRPYRLRSCRRSSKGPGALALFVPGLLAKLECFSAC